MKSLALYLLVFSLLIFIVPQSSAAPGDTVGEAFTAHLGEQQGSIDAYNDVKYYNFTAEKFQYYNFTLIPDPLNYNTFSVYDRNFNFLRSNVSGVGPKSIILIGHEQYIIAVYGSEFMEVYPGNYSLVIAETELEINPGPAVTVEIGSHNGTLELCNDIDWYNFTGSIDRLYEFKVTYMGNDSYTGLYIYSSNTHILEWNWKIGSGNSINRTGNEVYLIAVVSSEFAELPVEYILMITDITPPPTSSSSANTSSESETSTSETDQKSSSTSSSSSDSDALPLNFIWIVFAIPILPLIRKNMK